MSDQLILRKVARFRDQSYKPRVLDLFAGCGGLSLGFDAAGFEIRGAVEFDKHAANSHGINFHSAAPEHCEAIDIIETSPDRLCNKLKIEGMEDAFDVLIGGPPCQAFARVGRSKLREIQAHPEAFIRDPRAQLYKRYLEYVDAFRPVAVLMENVPDILNYGGNNVAEEICEVLQEKGYICGYTLLNSSYYGVPQMRERMFLIAYRKETGENVVFPTPTHWVELPPGYGSSRSVATKTLRNSISESHCYITPPVADRSLPPAITAKEALSDLPPIRARELLASGELRRGTRRFENPMPYNRGKPSPYAQMMRCWPGREAPEDGIRDHVIRYLPRDYELFARMKAGDQYPQAYELAEKMFKERLEKEQASGNNISLHSLRYKTLRASIVPPYDASKFFNKWRKMWSDKPARTLLAHLGKDGYSHIHYDSEQARTISVREAARLQSFPDGFEFSGTMNPAFRQIGNAVPPLLAKALADKVRGALQSAALRSEPGKAKEAEKSTSKRGQAAFVT